MNEIITKTQLVEEKAFAIPQSKEASIALFALVEALSYEIMSGDMWWLANNAARRLAVGKYGISEQSYDEVMEKVSQARCQKVKENPLHSMFECE